MKRTPLIRRTPMEGRRKPRLSLGSRVEATFPDRVKDLVRLRSGWLCERCNAAPASDYHHRRPKGMGGTSVGWVQRAANCAHLCGRCHVWVHAHPAEAMGLGWLLSKSSAADSADMVPMQDTTGRRFFFDDRGGSVRSPKSA